MCKWGANRKPWRAIEWARPRPRTSALTPQPGGRGAVEKSPSKLQPNGSRWILCLNRTLIGTCGRSTEYAHPRPPRTTNRGVANRRTQFEQIMWGRRYVAPCADLLVTKRCKIHITTEYHRTNIQLEIVG